MFLFALVDVAMHIYAYKFVGQQVVRRESKESNWSVRYLPSWEDSHSKGLAGGGGLTVFWSSGVWGYICPLLAILPHKEVMCKYLLDDGAWNLDFPAFRTVRILHTTQRKEDRDINIFSSYDTPVSSTYSIPHVYLLLVGCKHCPSMCIFITVVSKILCDIH